jgi:hypothetical protein
MTNNYKKEFDTVCTIDIFTQWLRNNNNNFYYNMTLTKPSQINSIRDWMKLFLMWSEYEDNKDGN